MNMEELRGKIDAVDEELLRAFTERMDIAGDIARYKAEHGLPVLDEQRERQKLFAVGEKVPEELQSYAVSLYSLLFELSRSRQNRLLHSESSLTAAIRGAIGNTPPLFPERAAVACQGVEGSNSQIACERLFRVPNELFFSSFDAVFNAIEKGLCRYGVLPIENSTAGSVNAVYDLMMRHHFHIVRSVRVKIDHNLLARPGAKLSGIREVYSHEQALNQCGRFLQSLGNVKLITCENTAMAAKLVAESGRDDVAALSTRSCERLYGLSCLADSVQDTGNNYTRFICITRDLEIYPGADRTSLMMTLRHEPGSLYKVLSRFYALGINLTKLESRPLPERNFEFMFYFDLENPVYDPAFLQLMGELGGISEEYTYLGSYSEVI